MFSSNRSVSFAQEEHAVTLRNRLDPIQRSYMSDPLLPKPKSPCSPSPKPQQPTFLYSQNPTVHVPLLPKPNGRRSSTPKTQRPTFLYSQNPTAHVPLLPKTQQPMFLYFLNPNASPIKGVTQPSSSKNQHASSPLTQVRPIRDAGVETKNRHDRH